MLKSLGKLLACVLILVDSLGFVKYFSGLSGMLFWILATTILVEFETYAFLPTYGKLLPLYFMTLSDDFCAYLVKLFTLSFSCFTML